MDRNEFRKRMQDLKSYRQSNPDKGYWDWKVYAFSEGGEVDNREEELLARQEESKRRLAVEKSKTGSTELTESEKRAQRDIDLVMNAMRDQADRISGKEFSNKISVSLKNVEQERVEDFNEKKYNYSLLLKSLGVAASAANIGTSVNALYRNYQFNNTLSNLKGYNDYLSAAQKLDKANKINNFTNLVNTSIDVGQAINDPLDISNTAQIVGNAVNSIPTNSIPLKAVTTLINVGTDVLNLKDTKDIISEFAEGGEAGDDEKEYLKEWFSKRKQYANTKAPFMRKQLEGVDFWGYPSKYSLLKGIDNTDITISDSKIKQAFSNAEVGGYYHPNEGVVLPSNYIQWKDREPLLHEMSHIINTFNTPIHEQINSIIKGKSIINRGKEVNEYLIQPQEVHSRLMEFRKLNDLDPTKVYGIPDIREWRRSGKDSDLLNTFDDNTVLELINTVAYTPNKKVQRVAEGGEIEDKEKEQQITNAITYALSRGNVDAAKSLMRRGTPNTNYYYPQSGAIDPVFSLYDTPVLGDAMTTTDAARYAMNGDWANAGLAMAGLILPGVVGKGIKKVNRHIPSVKGYKESVENQINRIMDPQDLQKQSDWNNMLYRSAEQVYEPDVINRAAATGTTDRLNRVRSMYENDLENMPKIRMTDELNGARGRVQLTKEAEQRYRQGIKPSDSDFEILVDRNIDPTQEVIDHELRHWNQYMEQGSPNINVMPTSTRSGVRPTSKNKLDPNHSDYYGKQGESEAYILNAYRDMKQKGYQINLKNFKKYYNSLKDIDTKKRAISQFSSLEDAYKWMQSMPLIGTAGVIAMNNKEQSN